MHCELEFLHIPKLIRPKRRFIMKLALRNRLFAFISFSRIFNILGSSIYNIVFIVFASSMPQPKFAVGIANFIVLVPTFFTVFVGMKAPLAYSSRLFASLPLHPSRPPNQVRLLPRLCYRLLSQYLF